ncbi:MAG TPA: DUF1501 domain-containing protein [Bryobacteraceae bacterium]|nr:DUF1501 domain-containing protein [Bryobacteraceae bacterium]
MSQFTRSRRSVLRFGVKAAAAYGLANLASPLAPAASSVNRACVCLYLNGGNDSNNMIVPLDSPAYELYARARGPLAIPESDLLSVYSAAGAANYGFHPNLPGIRDLYSRGLLAVLANVGRADAPLNPAQVKANPALLPGNLFEHTAGSQFRYLPNGFLALPWTLPAEPLTRGSAVTVLQHDVTEAGSPTGTPRLGPAARLSTNFPQTTIGLQLETVVNRLKGGISGQHGFVCIRSGFATPADQLAKQAALFSEIDQAVTAFYGSLEELGIADRVTLFSESEFNRTLLPNRTGGTESAWGGHQLILGRSVLGGQVYGRFPSLELGGADDAGTAGIWIPSTSDVQYAATLATWMGRTDLANVPELASLRNFASPDLGFMVR